MLLHVSIIEHACLHLSTNIYAMKDIVIGQETHLDVAQDSYVGDALIDM